jgi:EAL domain-containing protein (putative c-di-GMP-specific phosphodiesterase class I)
MPRLTRRSASDADAFLLVAWDPAVIAVTREAARILAGSPDIRLVSPDEALHRLVGPGPAPAHVVLEDRAGHPLGQALLQAAADPFSGVGVVVVAPRGGPSSDVPAVRGLRTVMPDADSLAAALGAPRTIRRPLDGPEALATGLLRGEITVRFQPIVSLADRRLLLLEALARWERPDAALGAAAFVGMAERAGLAAQLAAAVASRALSEWATLPSRRHVRLTFNMPLAVLLQPDLPRWLAEAVRAAGLGPRDLLVELTESMAVTDTSQLGRALQRLRTAGFGVLLDDLALDDRRAHLLQLPFAGVKLDRGLVNSLPASFRARAEVRQIVRRAHAAGMFVVAEGVADPRLWRAALAAGCDMAQGFGVGRPLSVAALPAWETAWRAAMLEPPRQG